MTQLERVVKAARSFRGTCQADWLANTTPDDGPRITRVGARIQEAEDRLGATFEIIGWRGKTKVYRLVDVPRDTAPPTAAPATPQPGCVSQSAEDTLFENTAEPTPHWKSEAA